MAAQETDTEEAAKVNIRFLFAMCNDVSEVRTFYSDLLGMKETSFKDEEDWGWLVYKCEGFEFMFFRAQQELPALEDFTWQPGGGGGPIEGVSWGIEIPWDAFPETMRRLKDAEVKSLTENPVWRQDSYWGFSVLDPMGNTVEVYSTPVERPESTEWVE